jgi:hypothetical protein
MGRVRLLDEAMNEAGYLRLCTTGWHVQHLGNTVPSPQDLIGNPAAVPIPRKPRKRTAGIWAWPPLRKMLQWVYGWSFDRLHRGE